LETPFDFVELATLTDGYSGSDLKNLSIAAAYKPIREVLQKEVKKYYFNYGNLFGNLEGSRSC
jgi:SpoVK/Ycf46/Vps4 family AAA+-type ATPase